MRLKTISFASVFLAIVAFATTWNAQEAGRELQPTDAEWNEAVARRRLVEKELSSANNPPWAGVYHWGSLGFSGAMLYIAPKSGFVYRPYTDYDPNFKIHSMFGYGQVEEKDGIVYLTSQRGIFGVGQKFHFIKWGDRSFLLPEGKIQMFLNFVNAGCADFQTRGQVGNLSFPTKQDEVKNRLFGRPTLKKEFDALLLSGELSTKVVAVGDRRSERLYPNSNINLWSRGYTNVTINAGKSNGIWAGMRLYLGNMILDIKTAEELSAEGTIIESFEGKELPPITPGLVFWSRLKAVWFENKRTAPLDCS